MLRVGIDARVLGKPEGTGVRRYTDRLLDAVCRAESGAAGAVAPALFGAEPPAGLATHERLSVDGPAAPHSGLRAHLWEQLRLPLALWGRDDLDVFHTPAGAPPTTDLPSVTTIHDVSPVVHPEWFSTGYAALYRLLTAHAVRTSDRIVTVSEFARDEIRERYPRARGRIEAIHNGVTPRDPAAGEPVPTLADRRFLLFVGAHNPRKNLATLVEAYRRYRRRVDEPATLALAGPDRDVFASPDLPRVPGVRSLGYVSEATLTWLYDAALALAFPSLYEGFGLPILEAMALGTAVVTSDRGATAEVAGEAAHLVDPTDADALAAALVRLTDAPDHRADLAARGRTRAAEFDWARTAERTAAVYRSVAD